MEVSAKINLNIEKLFEAIANKLPKIAIKKRENIDLTDEAKPAEGSNCQSCWWIIIDLMETKLTRQIRHFKY